MKIFIRILRVLLGLVLLGVFAFAFMSAYSSAPDSAYVNSLPEPTEEGLKYLNTVPTTPEPAEPETTVEPTPTPEPTVDPNSPAGRAEAKGLPAPPEIDITSWEFVLANGDNSIQEYEPPELVTYENDQKLDSRIMDSLKAMVQDSRDKGYNVFISSGYRSYAEQAANFTRICNNNGVSDGKDSKGFYITMPAGCSEHQTGLCCDITDQYYQTKNSSIENTALFQYMSKNCQEFGYILRFPSGKEEITGVMYEPWHYRYVGVEAAAYIMENDLTLEEFLELYK